MTRPWFLPYAFVTAAWLFLAGWARAVDTSAAVAWYDTLGYPDVAKLPYVHVATGASIQFQNKIPEDLYVDGFLVSEEPGAFTVFICSVSRFEGTFERDEPYPPLTTVRFVRKVDGPAYQRVFYEKLDFPKAAADVLARVRAQAKAEPGLGGSFGLRWGRPVSHRARIFAFARACQQKGLSEIAAELMDITAKIPEEQTGEVRPSRLRQYLQEQIGEAVLVKAEQDFGDPSHSWADLLKVYEHFDTQYPANSKVAYAREAAELLRKMIAEDAAHHPKPLEKMSSAEQVAENIYQLRNLGLVMWTMDTHYPAVAWKDGKEIITPIHRLVDLGDAAVPQLIEALDDRRFTRCMVMQFNGLSRPEVMRVSDVAQKILEFRAGRSFFGAVNENGKPEGPTARQRAEAWWAEVQATGERQSLVKATAAGGQAGPIAARKLVEKYPDAAIPAIEAGIRATPGDGERGEFVEVAGLIPGDAPLPFLRAQLAPDHGMYSRMAAAEALFARGDATAVPAIIEAWRHIQPRLPKNEGDAWSEGGRIIFFLAKSGDPRAIDALRTESAKDPIDVRLATVQVFLPGPFSGGGNGESVPLFGPPDAMEKLPAGEGGAAVERLLVAALDDTAQRKDMFGFRGKVSYKDPRICDMAAYILSVRWPARYAFNWTGDAKECDGQIAPMRNRWRSEHGLPPLPVP